jgi:hypothetical protein
MTWIHYSLISDAQEAINNLDCEESVIIDL